MVLPVDRRAAAPETRSQQRVLGHGAEVRVLVEVPGIASLSSAALGLAVTVTVMVRRVPAEGVVRVANTDSG